MKEIYDFTSDDFSLQEFCLMQPRIIQFRFIWVEQLLSVGALVMIPTGNKRTQSEEVIVYETNNTEKPVVEMNHNHK